MVDTFVARQLSTEENKSMLGMNFEPKLVSIDENLVRKSSALYYNYY